MTRKLLAHLDGALYFLYLPETIESFLADPHKEDHDHLTPKDARLVDNPEFSNQILIYDLPTTDYGYGCSVRIFLHRDGKFLGKATFVPESGEDSLHIAGTYAWENDQLWLKGYDEVEDFKENFVGIFKKKPEVVS